MLVQPQAEISPRLFPQFVVVDGLMMVALARSGAIKMTLKSFILLYRFDFEAI
jgi:hypothetical protein